MSISLLQYLNQLDNPLVPTITDFNIAALLNPAFNFNLFPELSMQGSFNKASLFNIETKNTQIYFKYLISHTKTYSYERYQDRLLWLLSCLYLDGSPFLILRNTVREGDSFPNILLLDFNLYKKACFYLFQFLDTDVDFSNEPYLPLSGSLLSFPSFMPPPKYLSNNILDVPFVERALNHILSHHSFY